MIKKFILLDLERTISTGYTTYWKPNQVGYTRDLVEAGLYIESEANEIVESDFDKRTVAISEYVIDNILQ